VKKKKSPRRGVVISGAYGMDNAGDDEVLGAILAQLRAIDGAMPIMVLARQPEKTALRFGVSTAHLFRLWQWLPALGRARLFISGGGTLLQDVTSRRNLLYYLFTIWAAYRRGCGVMLYGCGVGPISWPLGRRLTARILNSCAQVITLRDGDSLALLQAMGVSGPALYLAADPALNGPVTGLTPKPQLGVAVRPWPGFEGHIPALAQAVRYAWERYGLQPLFLCFAPQDEAPARKIMEELSDVPCAVTRDVAALGAVSLVLSMRLHGLVFALRDEIPAVGVSYDEKVKSFCCQAGYSCLALEDVTGPALCRCMDGALARPKQDIVRASQLLKQRERINGAAAGKLLSQTT
jgi:polysaccharide pyruvyl transferase CsaB